MDEELVISQTRKWVRDVVIDLNLCPFAANVESNKSVRYTVEESKELESALETFLLECIRLDNDEDVETTLVIFPNSFKKFDDYLDLLDLVDELIEQNAYDGVYQVASFHPEYQFEGSEKDDAANFTNRSPYPMLHIIRESSVEEALLRYPNAHQIPERNIAFAREKGLAYMQMLRDACLRV